MVLVVHITLFISKVCAHLVFRFSKTQASTVQKKNQLTSHLVKSQNQQLGIVVDALLV